VLQMIRVRSAFKFADANSDHALDSNEFHKVLCHLGVCAGTCESDRLS